MKQAFADLKIAEQEIERMAAANKFSEFEPVWQAFLFRIERVWDYSERLIAKYPKGQSWISKHARMRKKDPLLCYIRQARHSETHALGPTLGRDIIVSVSDKLGRPFLLDSVEVTYKDGVLHYNLNTPTDDFDVEATVVPGNPSLVRFKNRGEWFNPPKEHLGAPLANAHPVALAMLCVAYYKKAIEEAESIANGL